MYEIIDNNGTIHSGNENEMEKAYYFMINELPEIMNGNYAQSMNSDELHNEFNKWNCQWDGDLKLVKIINISR